MVHTEQIEVFLYTRIPNASGGSIPALPERQLTAPTWATVKQASGYDIQVNGRLDTESIFKITVNVRPGFSWQRKMFVSTRFGFMDIFNIYEDTRKRTIKLLGVRVEGSNASTGTTPGIGNGIKVLYQETVLGSTSINIPALVGATVLLAFRDGIGKEVVALEPVKPEQMQFASDGTFTLMTGDMFGNELLTVLYKI